MEICYVPTSTNTDFNHLEVVGPCESFGSFLSPLEAAPCLCKLLSDILLERGTSENGIDSINANHCELFNNNEFCPLSRLEEKLSVKLSTELLFLNPLLLVRPWIDEKQDVKGEFWPSITTTRSQGSHFIVIMVIHVSNFVWEVRNSVRNTSGHKAGVDHRWRGC